MTQVSVYPGTLAQALQSPDIHAGDRLLLREGIYTGDFTCLLQGTVENRIVIRSYPSETAIIDGSLTVGNGNGDEGSYLDIRGLHIKKTGVSRGTWEMPQGAISINPGFQVMGHHVRLINNIVHDVGVGIGHWNNAYGGVVYGNVVYNCGWADDNQGGAESLYIQGNDKTIKHNVFGPAFKRTLAAYGNNAAITNSSLTKNVIFARQGVLIGSGNVPVDGVAVDENHIIRNALVGGYTHNQNGSLTITNNRIYAAADKALYNHYFLTLSISGNVFIGAGSEPSYQAFENGNPADTTGLSWTINNNTYRYLGAATPFGMPSGGFGTWAQWQALGHDAASTYATTLPAANEVFVYANEYTDANDKRRGIVVIWNWEGSNSVSVDLSALNLSNGAYRWRQAQDPLTDTGTFEYSGAAVSFAMTGHTVAKPTAFDEELVGTQFPTFGCFVIEAA